jgi:hypothetical protein
MVQLEGMTERNSFRFSKRERVCTFPVGPKEDLKGWAQEEGTTIKGRIWIILKFDVCIRFYSLQILPSTHIYIPSHCYFLVFMLDTL